MFKLDKFIDHKIVQNIFVWAFIFMILMITVTSGNKLLTALYVLLFLMPPVYVHNYWIMNFFHKKLFLFIVLFIANIFVFSLIALLMISKSMEQGFDINKLLPLVGLVLLAVIFGMTIRIARDSFRRRQQEKEAELKLLKAQLNPHFLFNTLNNLYGLSVVKSDKLPGLMLQLSDLLRYSLYETKEVFVPLEKEISYLENYISLEKIRLEEKTKIKFLVKGNIADKQIAPMLLIVFVENAFKHLGEEQNEKSSVAMSIEITENTLNFICKNSYDTSKIKEENLEKGKSGIGLVNAKKRLALIYPDVYDLSIKRQDGFFEVALKLEL